VGSNLQPIIADARFFSPFMTAKQLANAILCASASRISIKTNTRI